MNLRVSSPGQGHKSVSTWLLHWLGRKHVNISTKTSRPIREKTRTEDTMAHKNSFMHKQELENKPQLLWVNIVVSKSYLPRGNKRHSVPIQTLQNWGGLVKKYIYKNSLPFEIQGLGMMQMSWAFLRSESLKDPLGTVTVRQSKELSSTTLGLNSLISWTIQLGLHQQAYHQSTCARLWRALIENPMHEQQENVNTTQTDPPLTADHPMLLNLT